MIDISPKDAEKELQLSHFTIGNLNEAVIWIARMKKLGIKREV